MLKFYGYIGLLLIALASINFYFVIQPFALFYVPIIFYGLILFIDSLTKRVRGRSLILDDTKGFIFMVILSIFFWSIFEGYNLFTKSWTYIHFTWYVHIIDFSIIMPAVLELYTLLGGTLRIEHQGYRKINKRMMYAISGAGAVMTVLPFFASNITFPFMWVGLFFLLDPLNAVIGNRSISVEVLNKNLKTVYRLLVSGITIGFFWELWNYFAYPKWLYTFPFQFGFKLFEMPIFGYLGYLPFALEIFAFYVFFRSFILRDSSKKWF